MIKLKPRPTPPLALNNLKVQNAKNRLEKKVISGQKPTTTKPTDFPPYWNPEARKKLWIHQNYKCCYCESIRGLKRESDLEHYRPKAKVEDDDEHYGYWWLAYEWENYLYSCKPCNEDYKKSKFPLRVSGIRARRKEDLLGNENPILLNPFDDNPEDFISFEWEDSKSKLVKAISAIRDIDNRGRDTIDILGLNERNLPEERAGFLLTLESLAQTMIAANYMNEHGYDFTMLIEKTHNLIKQETSSNKSFTGFRRAYFRKFDLSDYISSE